MNLQFLPFSLPSKGFCGDKGDLGDVGKSSNPEASDLPPCKRCYVFSIIGRLSDR